MWLTLYGNIIFRYRKHATSKDIAWKARGGHSVVVLLLMYYM
ncbi:unnamed protein product [Camellia sinensis]